MTRIALATCEEYEALDEDDLPLLAALRAEGVRAEPLVWTRPHDPADWDLIVLRSTWDYVTQRERFLAWAERCPRLVNSAALVRWNTDKRYLGQLIEAGVPASMIVPTRFFAPGEAFEPPAYEHVVKPTISAGARDTHRHAAFDPSSLDHVRGIQASGRTVMLQPYIPSVDARGETALLFFDGVFSHAASKAALLPIGAEPVTGLFARETVTARTPTPAELEVAERVLAAVPAAAQGAGLGPGLRPAYARVDLVLGEDGGPQLLELEMTEPSLFLRFGEGAAQRLARIVIGWAREAR